MTSNYTSSLRHVFGRYASIAAATALLLGLTFLVGSGTTAATAAAPQPPQVQRCATADPNTQEMLSIEQQLKAVSDTKSKGASRATTNQVINVYFHVITSSTGQGAVSNSGVNRQIRVLNDGFAGTGFSFVLAGIDRTAN